MNNTPLQSLIACGTKLWLDSIDPTEIQTNLGWGTSGATSNPIIIADLIKTGRFDADLLRFQQEGMNDERIAWALTDMLVQQAQRAFLPVWERTRGDDGYVSFELDPLLEDPDNGVNVSQRVEKYIELGKKWSRGHKNRMIKVPATHAGLASLEELAAADVSLNVTLIFSERQYLAARDAVWRGALRRSSLDRFKSVYSIFVSRLDVYTEKHVPTLSPAAQGMVGIVNAKRIWKLNQDFWARQKTPRHQEMIFASTGTKKPSDPADKYVSAFAGSDIETNPPATNDAVQKLGKTYLRRVDQLPDTSILQEIDRLVDMNRLENVLMEEGIAKFADPQKALLRLIRTKRER